MHTVVHLCEATTANPYMWLWPFHKLQASELSSEPLSLSDPSCLITSNKLVFLPVARAMTCNFSRASPELLSYSIKMSQFWPGVKYAASLNSMLTGVACY